MRLLDRGWHAATLIAALAVAPLVHADVLTDPALEHGFDGFCARWMEKLRVREADNARAARIVKNDTGYVGEFKGYGRKPLRCRARPTGSPSTPWVGQLVYEEFVYRKHGKSLSAARSSKPEIAARTHVLEIFKFDGSRWVY
jgi:hypothetical protein